MKEKMKVFKEVFLSSFRLSAMTFGGGYVMIPMLKKRFVQELGWLDGEEIDDLIAIAQSAPGAVAVNTAVMVGYRLCGAAGALAALIGMVLPPVGMISVLFLGYRQFSGNNWVRAGMNGMQVGVAAVICSVAVDMLKDILEKRKTISMVIAAVAFLAIYFGAINAAAAMGCCAVVGVGIRLIEQGRRKKK